MSQRLRDYLELFGPLVASGLGGVALGALAWLLWRAI
jgi:hypothetical protein